jgi:hypothetical protein
MNRYFLPFAFYLIACTNGLAQSYGTFLKSFDPNPQDTYVFDKGTNIWSIGNYLYVVNGFVNPKGGRSQQLFKIDATTREIVKQISMEGPQGDIVVSERGGYCVTADEYVYLTGGWRDYVAMRMRTFVAKLDNDLNIDWVNYYPDLSSGLNVYGDAISETLSGGILLYLVEGNPTVSNPWQSNPARLRIVKTDQSGQLIFNKIIPDTFNLTYGFGHLSRTDDGNFLLASNIYDIYEHPIFGTYFYTAIVHKIDSNANPIWSRLINRNQFNIQAPISTTLTGGGGAVMWSRDTFASDPEISFEVNELHRLNSDGETLWTHEWNNKSIRYTYRIITANNGDILGCGAYSHEGKGKTWLFRVTQDGDLLWERHYSDSIQRPWSPQLEMLDLCEMADGRIAAAGIVFDTTSVGSLNSNVGILVVDANGCLSPDCTGLNQYITGAFEPVLKSPSLPQLLCSPVPATDFVSVKLPYEIVGGQKKKLLNCYDVQGNLVSQINWEDSSAEQQIDVVNWLSGTYQLVFWAGRRPVFSGKIIVQH